MGYSDYGAFVYLDGARRPDREDCQPLPGRPGEMFHAALGEARVLLACDRLRVHLFVEGAEVGIAAYTVASPPRGCAEAWSGEIEGVRFSAYRYATSVDLHLLEDGRAWTANCGVGRGAGFEDD